MNSQDVSKTIYPCDRDRPYAFISYSRKDKAEVIGAVKELQQKGYNIWIDTELRKNDQDWRTQVKEVIKDLDCKLVLFFMSRDSLISSACLYELQCTRDEDVRKKHGNKNVSYTVVELEKIGSEKRFLEELKESYEFNGSIPKAKKEAAVDAITGMEDFVSTRIENFGTEECVSEIEKELSENRIEKFTVEEMYAKGIAWLSNELTYPQALDVIDLCANNKKYEYFPAILMSLFIYDTEQYGRKNPEELEKMSFYASIQLDESQWRETAQRYKDNRQYEEALAFYLAYATTKQSGRDYIEALKTWNEMNKPSFWGTKICAKKAMDLGNQTGKKLYSYYEKMSESEFFSILKNRK